MGNILPILTDTLSIDSYTALDVARWFELFMGVGLAISGRQADETVNFVFEDLMCAIKVEEDGTISEFIDLDEETIIALDEELDIVTTIAPQVYDSFEDYRRAVKLEYPDEAKIYSKLVIKTLN